MAYIRTAEHCKKLSEAQKGKKHSLETLKKMSESHKGIKLSVEHRIKLSKAQKGRIVSEETRKKLSEAQKGEKGNNFGKHPSEETRRKLGKVHKGSKNHNWKGGITPLVMQIRKCFEYRQWRSDNFTRDDYTCVWCGVRSGLGIKVILHADHIKSFATILRENNITTMEQALACEELWNLNNGRTLCLCCHKKTDTYAGKKINA